MGDILKDLCRLCAKQHQISKDLLDVNNKHVLDLIRQFTQISVTECDNMPTRVCLDCEERMVSFQLFILECYKVQDSLRKLCLDNNIKTEDSILDLGLTVIKSEEGGHLQVKDELLAEELLNNALQNNAIEHDYEGDNFPEASSEEDDLDNITIASLKQLKSKSAPKKETNEPSHKISKKHNSRIKNFIKLECTICESLKGFKSWPELRVHYINIHQSKPIAYCSCGFAIQSKSVLYKHIQDHKADSRRMKRDHSEGSDGDSHSSIKVSDFVRFKCQNCSKECSSWYTLRAHTERHHKQAPLVSCKCGVTLKSKSVMYKHVQDHKNPGNLSCNKCSKILKSVEALEKHMLRHVPKAERKFNCEACDKVFNNKDLLRSHERSHIPIEERKVFTCDVCNLKFTTRSSCASHRRVVHEKVKAYVCDLCGYACGTNGELRQHRAIHSDDKPFVCSKCNKPFKTYSNLKTHMDTHEDTSYVCYVCSRVLNSRRTLRKHLLVHEDKCRHVCSFCNKAFKRRQTLKVHMYTHTGDKPLCCKWCDERFSYASTLRSHRLRAHPDKMAAQHIAAGYNNVTPVTFTHVSQLQQQQQEYIKRDLAAIGIGTTKNESDTTQ